MHPILFTFPQWLPLLGGRGIHIYGFMIAVGFLTGMAWVKREARRVGLDEKRVMDVFFYAVISGLVGSRILYVIQSADNFWSDPLSFFRVWEGGLVFQGGIIGALIVVVWACRRYQIGFFRLADVFAPALSLGHVFGRIGCFFAGCCYGKQCDPHFPLGIVFPHIKDGIAPPGIPLYPTQLFESFGELLIFSFLVMYRKKKGFDGQVFLLYLILYSLLRACIELLRGDIIRGFVIEPYLSNGQFISLLTIVAAGFVWAILAKKTKTL